MKRIYLAILLCICTQSVYAQNWQAVGPDDFQQISSQGTYSANVYTDTLGNAYISYIDSIAGNYTYRRTVIKKETANGWIKITQIEDTNSYSSLRIDKSGNFYYANDTIIGSFAAIIVRKFDGISGLH